MAKPPPDIVINVRLVAGEKPGSKFVRDLLLLYSEWLDADQQLLLPGKVHEDPPDNRSHEDLVHQFLESLKEE